MIWYIVIKYKVYTKVFIFPYYYHLNSYICILDINNLALFSTIYIYYTCNHDS